MITKRMLTILCAGMALAGGLAAPAVAQTTCSTAAAAGKWITGDADTIVKLTLRAKGRMSGQAFDYSTSVTPTPEAVTGHFSLASDCKLRVRVVSGGAACTYKGRAWGSDGTQPDLAHAVIDPASCSPAAAVTQLTKGLTLYRAK